MSQPLRSLRSDYRPLYIQAVDALYELIEAGVYQPGQPLPTEPQLATQLGVSRSTVREALSYLEKDGVIVRKQGVGTFVAPRSEHISGGLERLASFRSVAELAGARVETVERTVGVTPAAAPIATALQVPEGSELVQVKITEAIAGCRIAYLEGFIGRQWVDLEQLATEDGSLLEHLGRRTDLPVSYSRSAIYALEADRTLAERLAVPEGKAILHLAETVYTDADMPIAFFRNYFVTDCYNFKIVRRVVRASGLSARSRHEGSKDGTV